MMFGILSANLEDMTRIQKLLLEKYKKAKLSIAEMPSLAGPLDWRSASFCVEYTIYVNIVVNLKNIIKWNFERPENYYLKGNPSALRGGKIFRDFEALPEDKTRRGESLIHTFLFASARQEKSIVFCPDSICISTASAVNKQILVKA